MAKTDARSDDGPAAAWSAPLIVDAGDANEPPAGSASTEGLLAS
jgi:hypothetical protein